MIERRAFLAGGMAAAMAWGSLAAGAAERRGKKKEAKKLVPRKIGTELRTRIAVNPQWFDGSHVEQMEQIAAFGFTAFESLRSSEWEDKAEVRARCEELGIQCGAIGGGMGSITEWGPNDPANHERFVEAVKASIDNARLIGSKRLVGLAGPVRKGVDREEQMEALVKAGQLVAPMVEDAGMVLVWETLNVLVNHPGYFLVYSADGSELVKRTDRPGVRFLFDVYHQQISEGNLINNIKKYAAEIGHYHFADNPGRHEPGTGEINYQNVFKAIYETGYRDVVACEFGKIKPTDEVLEILAECDRW